MIAVILLVAGLLVMGYLLTAEPTCLSYGESDRLRALLEDIEARDG